MYSVHPPKLYVTQWAMEDERCRERIKRMAAAMGHPDPPVVSADELAELTVERNWINTGGNRTGAVRWEVDPDVVLNAFVFDEDEVCLRGEQYPQLKPWMLLGQGHVSLRDSRPQFEAFNCICQTAIELHTAYGCLHACDYCHVGGLFSIMVNLEALAEQLPALWAENPWCRLWKFDNQTDTICLEPEYGASEVMVNAFAGQSEHFLLLYTKSDNVDHLLDLDPRGQTLISWSLSGPRAAQLIEKKAPPMEARIEAMRKCREAGYRVRARISPICPLEDWREEGIALLDALFADVRPELITMDVLGWMNARQMLEAMDVSLFAPEFRDYVHEQAKIPPGRHRKHLFPHEMRLELMRFYLHEIRHRAPGVPVSICMETVDMWNELGPELGMQADNYACCCGPDSVPGCRSLAR